MNEEIWKVCKDSRGNGRGCLWEVSTSGIIKKNGEVVEPHINSGYLRVSIGFVHRLVAETHIPNPENKPCVDHIDGNRYNNTVDNLRWVTYSENLKNPNTYSLWLPTVQNNKQGCLNPCFGKQRSEESKQKQREKMLGRTASDKTKENMSIARQNLIWVHIANIEKLINKDYLDYWLDDGWQIGRKRKNKI